MAGGSGPNGASRLTGASLTIQPADGSTPERPGSASPSSSALVDAAQMLAGEMHSQKQPSFTEQEQQAFEERLDAKILTKAYYRDKPNPPTNYSCQLPFVDPDVETTIDTPTVAECTNMIACRHLTAAYLRPNVHGKIVPPANAEEIQIRTGKWTEGWYSLVRAQVPNCHLLNNQNLGGWLVEQAEKLNTSPNATQHLEGTTDCQHFSLLTNSHSMALTLRRKVKKGIEHYVLTFYDPNITTNHKRYVVRTPKGFADLSLKNLIPEHLYALRWYYPGDSQQTLIFEIPSLEEEPRIFTQETILAAITTPPESRIRHLHRPEAVNWATLHPYLINEILSVKIVDFSLYRYLLGCKTQQQGQTLWQEGLTASSSTNAIRWNFFDATHVEQWLKLETQQLLSTEHPDFDGFITAWRQAMQKLPKDLQIKAREVFVEELRQKSSLPNFCNPSELNRFVQNTSKMLPLINASAPIGKFFNFLQPEKIFLLKKVEHSLLQILSDLKANPAKDQDLALTKVEGQQGSALLECQALIREDLQQNPTLAKQLPKLSSAVFEKANWKKMGVATSAWKKVRAALACLQP